jgi:hypothetical protein
VAGTASRRGRGEIEGEIGLEDQTGSVTVMLLSPIPPA